MDKKVMNVEEKKEYVKPQMQIMEFETPAILSESCQDPDGCNGGVYIE